MFTRFTKLENSNADGRLIVYTQNVARRTLWAICAASIHLLRVINPRWRNTRPGVSTYRYQCRLATEIFICVATYNVYNAEVEILIVVSWC